MGMFIDTSKIAVPDDAGNTVYVKARMDFGTKALVQDAIAQIQMEATGGAPSGGAMALNVTLGAYNLALMLHNIVGWAGPDFDRVPCTPENIRKLDPDNPIVDKVLSKINQLNVKRGESQAVKPAKDGDHGLTANASDSPAEDSIPT